MKITFRSYHGPCERDAVIAKNMPIVMASLLTFRATISPYFRARMLFPSEFEESKFLSRSLFSPRFLKKNLPAADSRRRYHYSESIKGDALIIPRRGADLKVRAMRMIYNYLSLASRTYAPPMGTRNYPRPYRVSIENSRELNSHFAPPRIPFRRAFFLLSRLSLLGERKSAYDPPSFFPVSLFFPFSSSFFFSSPLFFLCRE